MSYYSPAPSGGPRLPRDRIHSIHERHRHDAVAKDHLEDSDSHIHNSYQIFVHHTPESNIETGWTGTGLLGGTGAGTGTGTGTSDDESSLYFPDAHTVCKETAWPPNQDNSNGETEHLTVVFTPNTIRADRVKRFCFSRCGVGAQIAFNIIMALLTTFVVVYELLILKTSRAPLWYIALDVTIVLFLAAEVYVRFVEAGTKWAVYIRKPENRFDCAVMTFSAGVLLLYLVEYSSFAQDAQTVMLILRILRDVIRLARVAYFVKSLRNGMIDFDIVEQDSNARRQVSGPVDRHTKDPAQVHYSTFTASKTALPRPLWKTSSPRLQPSRPKGEPDTLPSI